MIFRTQRHIIMKGAPLPEPEDAHDGVDLQGLVDEMAQTDQGDPDLEQAVRDLIFDAKKRDGFRDEYIVSAEDLRMLARLVDLDSYLEH